MKRGSDVCEEIKKTNRTCSDRTAFLRSRGKSGSCGGRNGKSSAAGDEHRGGCIAVSYTHLDVYKRQNMDNVSGLMKMMSGLQEEPPWEYVALI